MQDSARQRRLKILLAVAIFVFGIDIVFHILHQTKYISISWIAVYLFLPFIITVFYLIVKGKLFDVDLKASNIINSIVYTVLSFSGLYMYSQIH
jgi:hypothetical protein